MTFEEMDARRAEINKGIDELRKGYEEIETLLEDLEGCIYDMKQAFDELDRLRGGAG